jgi:hypothetical protein
VAQYKRSADPSLQKIAQVNINPNPHCLGIYKAFFVKMKISLGWLKENMFLKINNASQKS